MRGDIVPKKLDALAEEHPEYKFCKVNVDDEEDLAARFGIMSIPSLFIFKNGENVKKSVGALPKDAILGLFE